ncbi:GDSL-type esterase/lipase family protein [Saccharopolyspora sp. NPDC049426]|uniref:GDSL-type esterase/lipase family protein n=1 Tax=Saccharopolyspora sp. NPDC049426 TaxID=3155652 RepID=UPI00342169EA
MRAHKSKSLILLLAGCLVALVVLISDQYLPGLPMQPKQLPAAVVTVGDSTLSGEGGGNYVAGTNGEDDNWCHRSTAAPVNQLRLPPDVTRINLACSGARTESLRAEPEYVGVEKSQTAHLAELAQRYRITDVVVQIGANDDPGFSEVVNQCVEAWARRAPEGCSTRLDDGLWEKRIDLMQPKALAVVGDIRAAMDRAGYTPGSYQLILQSYASPVAPEVRPELQGLSGCPFQTSDLAWIRDVGVPQLSAGLAEVAREANARFLDLSRAGAGHEACTGDPKAANGEWFTRLTVDWEALKDEQRAPHAMQESFHANATGHAQLARCLGQFMATTEPGATCLPDERGNLNAVPLSDAHR